ncbi:MAG: hypothetical protein AAGD25_40100 [Cyanobacteria bacterium P01_F01_bin.150]
MTQVDTPQVSASQIDLAQVNSREVPFSGSISLQEFLSSHSRYLRDNDSSSRR